MFDGIREDEWVLGIGLTKVEKDSVDKREFLLSVG